MPFKLLILKSLTTIFSIKAIFAYCKSELIELNKNYQIDEENVFHIPHPVQKYL